MANLRKFFVTECDITFNRHFSRGRMSEIHLVLHEVVGQLTDVSMLESIINARIIVMSKGVRQS